MIEDKLKKDQQAVPFNRREALKNMYRGKGIKRRLMDTVEQQLIGKK